MRRLLYSMMALSLLGLAMGCQLIGDGIGSDCCCESCGCAGGGPAPMTGPIPATPMPIAPEGIKEMPKTLNPSRQGGSNEGPARLTPEADLDLLK